MPFSPSRQTDAAYRASRFFQGKGIFTGAFHLRSSTAGKRVGTDSQERSPCFEEG
jgi:hypothetical protein